MKPLLTAVIPVRKNSQRVKNKNLKKFHNTNLLKIKIDQLKKIKTIDKIIVNTDSEKAIELAKINNIDYHRRDKQFASSKCSNSDFWSHIAETTNSEFIMFTNCTSPLISLNTLTEFIKIFKLKKNIFDSFNTTTIVKEYLYYKNKPLNFIVGKTQNSQDLPDIQKFNFASSIISKNMMLKKKTVIGNKPYLFKLSEVEGFDIDTEYDFNFAEYLYKKNK